MSATKFSRLARGFAGTRLTATTADATPLAMTPPSGDTLTMPNGSTWAFDVLVAARTTAGASGTYRIVGAIERGANAAATAILGTPTVTTIGEDTAGFDVAAAADTTLGALRINVTGAAATTVKWEANARLAEALA